MHLETGLKELAFAAANGNLAALGPMVRATLPNEDAQDLGGIRVDVPPEESLIRFAPPGECGSTSGVSRRPCIGSQPRTRALTVPFRTNNTPTTTRFHGTAVASGARRVLGETAASVAPTPSTRDVLEVTLWNNCVAGIAVRTVAPGAAAA